MELNGVNPPISPTPTDPITQPQAVSDPPEDEPDVTFEDEGGGKANGVINKLNSGHFEGKGVSDIRLRISHFDNPDLERFDPDVDPDLELIDPEALPEDGHGNAYEKFLAQYQTMYDARQISEEPVVEPPPVEDPTPDATGETPPVEDPTPDATGETPPAEEPAPEATGETPPTEEPTPVDEGEGALAAFEEILEQALEEEPETLDIVI